MEAEKGRAIVEQCLGTWVADIEESCVNETAATGAYVSEAQGVVLLIGENLGLMSM